jgi:hypothetical protein
VPISRRRPRHTRRVKLDAPRPLTDRERSVLGFLLDSDFDGVDELRAQSTSAFVVGRCDCGCPTIDSARTRHRRPRACRVDWPQQRQPSGSKVRHRARSSCQGERHRLAEGSEAGLGLDAHVEDDQNRGRLTGREDGQVHICPQHGMTVLLRSPCQNADAVRRCHASLRAKMTAPGTSSSDPMTSSASIANPASRSQPMTLLGRRW